MPRKKYEPFKVGDLIVAKKDITVFIRNDTGKRISAKGDSYIDKGSRMIFMGAKKCPHSTMPWRKKINDNYEKEKMISIKLMFNAKIYVTDQFVDEIYQVLKLVQSIHH